MLVDWSGFTFGETKFSDIAPRYTVEDLKETTQAQINAMIALVAPLTDAQVTHIAHDPDAPEGIGWNAAHLVAHVTASSEENVAVSSVLARGIAYPFEPRLRHEVAWETLTTAAQCVARLEESCRIQLGYLSTWPDQPDLTKLRELPPPFAARVGDLNAVGTVLLGLIHAHGHMPQLREIVRQALSAG